MSDLRAREKIAIMLALMVSLLFAAINQTIVRMALPHMIAEMHELDNISWLFNAYIVAAAVPALLAGQLSDVYGRKPFLIVGLLLFILGSLLSGHAQQFVSLVAFRFFQGLGAGIIITTAFSAVADLFSLRQRARWHGLLGSTFGFASIIGPVVGGYVVDLLHWRWVFWISVPLGLLALMMILVLYPSRPQTEFVDNNPQRHDIVGTLLLTVCMTLLLLVVNWQPISVYGYLFSQVVLLFAFILVAGLLLVVECRADKPVIPLQLFTSSLFSTSNLVIFLLGASIFAAIAYMPLFMQSVLNMSMNQSGVLMMLLMLSLVVSSIVSGHYLQQMESDRLPALSGLALVALGLAMLSAVTSNTDITGLVLCLLTIGTGIGIGMPVFNQAVQEAVEPVHTGSATAMAQLSRQLGGALGIACMGSIMSGEKQLMDISQLNTGLSYVFVSAAVVIVLAMMAVAFIRERVSENA